ncbi:MAG: transcriptional repressor [Proteiniphilum sp.]|jgi:Fur family ferric uptake transcriptional regulator|nr:transcriptional repressor [Proteiniphilum sp.]
MDTKHLEATLHHREIKPTAIRMLVLETMLNHETAFSLSDLESTLKTVDKSTLSRTINLFRHHHLIHSIDDGSGSVKYSVCRTDCQCTLGDLHVHFHCNKCRTTHCMESISIPDIPLPPDFLLENVNFVMKGICARCARKTPSTKAKYNTPLNQSNQPATHTW